MAHPSPPVHTPEGLAQAFTYHRPVGDQPHRYEAIRAAARQLAEVIVANCPEAAETTLALRRVQEASMWANASIAINGYGDTDAPAVPEELQQVARAVPTVRRP